MKNKIVKAKVITFETSGIIANEIGYFILQINQENCNQTAIKNDFIYRRWI